MTLPAPFTDDYLGLEILPDGGSWTAVPMTRLGGAGVAITRNPVDPCRMTFSVWNGDGLYCPRNPRSALYGTIRRGTPVRAYVQLGPVRGQVWQLADQWTAPDTAATSVTGDIDLRVDLHPGTWRPASMAALGLAKEDTYALSLTPEGLIDFTWTPDGSTWPYAQSTLPVPAGGRLAVRVTLDVNNGASGRTVAFYTAPTIAGPWTALGTSVVTAGTTSLRNGTSPTRLSGSSYLGTTQVFAAEVRSGIGGTVVASPTPTAAAAGATSFTDAQGNVWTAAGDAEISARHYRFAGEVVAWPQTWGRDGDRNAVAELECAGPLRRMAQGATVPRSPLYRTLSALGADLAGYWPVEDADGSTRIAAVKGRPGTVSGGPSLGAYPGFVASEPVATLQGGTLAFTVPAYATSTAVQVRHVAVYPSSTPTGAVLFRVNLTGTLAAVQVKYAAGGSVTIEALDEDDALITSTTSALAIAGVKARYSLELAKSGSNVTIGLVKVAVGATSGVYATLTATGRTLGKATSVVHNPRGASLGDTAVGHVTVERSITTAFDVSRDVLVAYAGETAATRAERVGTENGITVRTLGSGDGSTALGVQALEDYVSALRAVAESDGGILVEPRSGPYALLYRTRRALMWQAPAVALTYTDNLVGIEPTDDDQGLTNQVTVTRAGGGSATTVIAGGPLGTATVGLYDSSATLGVATDDDAERASQWLAALGTHDEARYPTVTIPLHHPTFTADAELTRKLLTLDLGDVLTVTGLPTWLPPDDARLLVTSLTESIGPRAYTLELKGDPARPWRVARWTTGGDRWDGGGTTVATALAASAGATSLVVAPPAGVKWTTADGAYDITVGGERMTVTAVTALAGGTQTMTVVRAVNGALRAHAVGTAVALLDPSRYGL